MSEDDKRIGPMLCKYGIYHSDYNCDCEEKRAGLKKAFEKMKAHLEAAPDELTTLRAENTRLRESSKKLHRRCQQAESALPQWQEAAEMAKEQRTGRFFPAVMASALIKAQDENTRLRELLGEAVMELSYGLHPGLCDRIDDELRKGE